jgi:hypothetical protein
MLCRPELREEFIAAARAVCGCSDEESILWNTVNLRKKENAAERPETALWMSITRMRMHR